MVCACVQGILLWGPPGTGKTLSARAVANRTDACFIRVIGACRLKCGAGPMTAWSHVVNALAWTTLDVPAVRSAPHSPSNVTPFPRFPLTPITPLLLPCPIVPCR